MNSKQNINLISKLVNFIKKDEELENKIMKKKQIDKYLKKISNFNWKDQDQNSLLSYFLKRSKLEVANLIFRGVKINENDSLGNNILCLAANKSKYSVFKFLMNLSDVYHKNNSGSNSLHKSMINPKINIEIVSSLIKYFSFMNYKTNNQNTPLIYACTFSNTDDNNNIKVIKLLIKKKASLHDKDQWNRTCLTICKERNFINCEKLLNEEIKIAN